MTSHPGVPAKAGHRIVLPDGRQLAYAEFGRADGDPVFYFHGAPSSRLEPLLLGPEILEGLGWRIIAPDRPGMGGSDFQPGRRITDWPADVIGLADRLGLSRFAVLGNSGGGPYAAVCAARIPERLRAVVIVSGGWRMDWPEARAGLPFPNRVTMRLARRAPFLLRLLLRLMGGSAGRNPEMDLALLQKRVPPADYVAFAAQGRLQALGQAMGEALRQGTRGAAWDLGLYVREFGFSLDEIRIPLTLFHGERDTNASIGMVWRAAARLPTARVITYPHEAHLSTLCNHIGEIGQALKEWQPEAGLSPPAALRAVRTAGPAVHR